MMKKINLTWHKLISNFLHWSTVIMLSLMGILLVVLMFKSFYAIITEFNQSSTLKILEDLFLIFLQIEIIAAIKIYFYSNYHFPLRFFLYMGVTDIIRKIIVVHNYDISILILSTSLILVILALTIWEVKNKKFINDDRNHLEL